MKQQNVGKAARMEEAARLLDQGLAHDEIAKQLGVHRSTVGDYAAQLRDAATKQSRQTARNQGVHPNASEAASEQRTDKRRRFLTIEQVAEELNVGMPTVRSLLASGELRGIQVGGRGLWRIGAQDLEDYISQAYREAAEQIATGGLVDEHTEG